MAPLFLSQLSLKRGIISFGFLQSFLKGVLLGSHLLLKTRSDLLSLHLEMISLQFQLSDHAHLPLDLVIEALVLPNDLLVLLIQLLVRNLQLLNLPLVLHLDALELRDQTTLLSELRFLLRYQLLHPQDLYLSRIQTSLFLSHYSLQSF
jgi:hypothetical protein